MYAYWGAEIYEERHCICAARAPEIMMKSRVRPTVFLPGEQNEAVGASLLRKHGRGWKEAAVTLFSLRC